MIALLCLLVIWNGYLTIELNHYKKEDPTKIQSNITVLKGVLTDITELVSKSELVSEEIFGTGFFVPE